MNTPLPTKRRWPLIASLMIGAILLLWVGVSVVISMGQSAVESEMNSAEPYTMSGKEVFPVTVHLPTGPPMAVVGIHPQTGEPLTASCTTCHSTRTPQPQHGSTVELDEFHMGLTFTHGNGAISCLSCHNPNDYDTLRAANGEAIAYAEVITLCAQCHSGQHEDYVHGAHGGMNGYWDLSQGPRTRNSCIDCHDPHSPTYPMMQPTFKPIDRGLNDSPAEVGHE